MSDTFTTTPPPFTTTTSTYTLDDNGEVVNWPAAHYVYVEQSGSISTTARSCWTTLNANLPAIQNNNTVVKHAALYCCTTEPNVYRAGVFTAEQPVQLPAAVQSTQYGGGQYVRYVVRGSLIHLPEASGRVYASVVQRGLAWKKDEMSVEWYLKDPAVTPADEMVTEILVPIA